MIGFTTATCPVTIGKTLKEEQLKSDETCEGFRKEGTLTNYCASCGHYKRYVELKFSDGVKHK